MISVKRFDNVFFGHKPKLEDVEFNQEGVFVAKIVDDSSYVPDSEFIRSHVASGSTFSEGVYDFIDGIDNGFIPAARGLGLDMAEVDMAAERVISDANKKVKDAEKQKASKAREDLELKVLNNLADSSPSDSSSSDSSNNSSE